MAKQQLTFESDSFDSSTDGSSDRELKYGGSQNSSASYLSNATSRDEMNLAEFPLAILSTRANPKIKTLEFTDTHRQKTGELVERKWIITGADKFGLPTATDDDVVLGLMRLTMDRGFRDRKVYFTRYELMKILRWSPEGRSYQRLTKSLDRLSGVRVRASNAFYDNSSKAFQTKNFGIIDAYEINDGRAIKGDSTRKSKDTKSFFIWSEVLFDSFKAGFIKKLDLDLYFSLSSAVSRRLYRYLDKHFYYRSSIERPLMKFAFEKIGLSRNYKYVSTIKQQLEPACQELIALGFLSSYEFRGRGELASIWFAAKNSGHQAKAAVEKNLSKETRTEKSKPSPIVLMSDIRTRVDQALVSRGISKPQSEKLLASKNDGELPQLERIISYFDHLVSTADQKISRNPIGFLYRAVEKPEQFSVPADFQTSAQAMPADRATLGRRRPELKIFRAGRR